jgi:hypothetical protein
MSALLDRYRQQAENELAIIERLKRELDKDPAYALSWGTDAFAAAAKLRVLRQLIAVLADDTATVEDIRAELTARVLRKSQYLAHSSSQTSNLIEQYELVANAELLNDLPRYKFDN